MPKYPSPEDTWLQNQIAALMRRVAAIESGAGLTSSSITKGKLSIRGQGQLHVSQGANIEVRDGGDVVVRGGGDVVVRGGGVIRAFDTLLNREATFDENGLLFYASIGGPVSIGINSTDGTIFIRLDGGDNAAVGGRIATSIETTNSSDFTSETSIGSVTGNVVAGRTYSVSCNASVRGNNAGDLVACRIREDTVGGAQRQRGYVVIGSASEVRSFDVPLYYEFQAAATESKTFHVTASRIAGSGTIGRRAAGDEPQITHMDYVRG